MHTPFARQNDDSTIRNRASRLSHGALFPLQCHAVCPVYGPVLVPKVRPGTRAVAASHRIVMGDAIVAGCWVCMATTRVKLYVSCALGRIWSYYFGVYCAKLGVWVSEWVCMGLVRGWVGFIIIDVVVIVEYHPMELCVMGVCVCVIVRVMVVVVATNYHYKKQQHNNTTTGGGKKRGGVGASG